MRTADPAKVRRIIDAAIQLFAERPFHEVRMEDIAARAKVAKGTLYLHYKDKEDLFAGIMNDGLQVSGRADRGDALARRCRRRRSCW